MRRAVRASAVSRVDRSACLIVHGPFTRSMAGQASILSLLTGLLATISPEGLSSWCPGLVTKPEPRQEPWNIEWAKELAREVREADAGKGLELIFYGDSITEQWRGTDQGGCIGDTAIFDEYFGSKYRSLVLAVGGDQVGHLEWRLENGDIPKAHHPRAAVIMIGTNDLGAAQGCSGGDAKKILETAQGVKSRINDTITLLREKLPETHLLMLGILPRGDGTNSSTTYRWPGIYTPAISSVNDWLIEVSEKEEKISYLDCGPMLLYNGQIIPAYQVDGLHPSPVGMLSMARCISPMLDEIMQTANPSHSNNIHDLEGLGSRKALV